MGLSDEYLVLTRENNDSHPLIIWIDKQARDQAVESHRTAFGDNCSEDCLKAQLDAYHKDVCKIQDDTKIKTVVEGRCKPADVEKAGGQKLLDKYAAKTTRKSKQRD